MSSEKRMSFIQMPMGCGRSYTKSIPVPGLRPGRPLNPRTFSSTDRASSTVTVTRSPITIVPVGSGGFTSTATAGATRQAPERRRPDEYRACPPRRRHQFSGSSPSRTVTASGFPSRSPSTVTSSPTRFRSSRNAVTSSIVAIFSPSSAWMMSPTDVDHVVAHADPPLRSPQARTRRRPVGGHLADDHALLGGQRQRLGHGRVDVHPADPQPRMTRPAAGDELGQDLLHRVDGHGKPDPDRAAARREDGGVDPDHLAARIQQGAAGVPLIDGGVGLDHVPDLPAGLRLQAAPHGAHHPPREGAIQAERIPDGNRPSARRAVARSRPAAAGSASPAER